MAIYYQCSDGERVTEATIQKRYSQALKEKHRFTLGSICEGCGKRKAEHNDHTIAKARCKVIHKTELIWSPENFVDSCPKCHDEWEALKSGDWVYHHNVAERLAFMKIHDPEGFRKRIHLTLNYLEE